MAEVFGTRRTRLVVAKKSGRRGEQSNEVYCVRKHGTVAYTQGEDAGFGVGKVGRELIDDLREMLWHTI